MGKRELSSMDEAMRAWDSRAVDIAKFSVKNRHFPFKKC